MMAGRFRFRFRSIAATVAGAMSMAAGEFVSVQSQADTERADLAKERQELHEAITSGDPAAIAQEYGDLLLTMASLGRHLDVCGEDALREANARFEGRFRRVESLAAAAGVTMEEAGLTRLEAFYQQAKQQARQQEPEKT